MTVLLTFLSAAGLGLYFSSTIGLFIFGIGFINYVLLMSFRINTNFYIHPSRYRAEKLPFLENTPSFSILVPLKQEDEVIHATLEAIDRLHYPRSHKQVIIVVEETDHTTQKSLSNFPLPANFEILYIPELPPFTKGRALLHALAKAEGTYITVYDAESRPEPYQLQKAAYALINAPDDTCFQAKIKISNQGQSWVTRNFAGEYDEWYERHLSDLSTKGLPFGLGGNSFFISKKALEQAGAWDPFNVTEDADLSVRLVENGVKLRILNSTTTETCPETPKNWINQRTRWNKGLFITQLVHVPRTFSENHFRGESWLSFWLPMICAALTPFFNLYIPLYMTWSRISYPLLLVLSTALWALFGFNLICSFLINFLTYRRLKIKSHSLFILTDWFFYLFLHIIAGFKAYWEYFVSPMHWHKTDHAEKKPHPDELPIPVDSDLTLT
jgi:cellulose synthase/poly-beta-1,6-N-acetylglucosamine synthase-like glycosyltransferase